MGGAVRSTATELSPGRRLVGSPRAEDDDSSRTPSAPVALGASPCMPFEICGCNVGCAGFDAPPDKVREGLGVTIRRGQSIGTRAWVRTAKKKGGGTMLVLGDEDPGSDVRHP